VFIIRRSEWEKLKIEERKLIPLDINDLELFPFSPILTSDEYLGTIASRDGDRVRIALYRLDPKDDPTPINVDFYTVWESLPPKYDIPEMVISGSTSNDQNFQSYLGDHVFLVKEEITDGHWLEKLPTEIAILLERP